MPLKYLQANYSIWIVLAAVCLSGCGSDKRFPVSGMITLNGEPLGCAEVQFIPLDQSALNTRTGTITKADGSFRIPRKHGLEPGEYIATVYSTVEFDVVKKTPATVETPPARILSKVLTPPEYNVKSKLRFTVSAKGRNTYLCDVRSNVSRDFPAKAPSRPPVSDLR